MAEAPEYEELIGRATTISAMIHMGEKIAWGADTAVIDELAAALRASLKEIAYLDEQNEKHASIAEKALLRAEAAEAAEAEVKSLRWGRDTTDEINVALQERLTAAEAEVTCLREAREAERHAEREACAKAVAVIHARDMRTGRFAIPAHPYAAGYADALLDAAAAIRARAGAAVEVRGKE